MKNYPKPHRRSLVQNLLAYCGIGSTFIGAAMLAARGNAAEVTAQATTTSVQVAQPFTLEVTVTTATGSHVSFPVVNEQLGDFEVRDSEDRFDVPVGNERTWTRRLMLDSLTTGDLQIPALNIQVQENGRLSNVETKPINVHVASVLEDRGDPTKFRDIHSVVDVAVPNARSNAWLWWSMGGIAGVATLAGVAMVMRRGKWLTPGDWAVAELNRMEASLDAHQIDSDGVAQGISEVLRSYLLMQFSIDDAGWTPQEILQQISARKWMASDCSTRLGNLFALADQVRFAGWTFSAENLRRAIRDSRELVQQISAQVSSNPEQQPEKPLSSSSSAPVSSDLSSHTHSEAV